MVLDNTLISVLILILAGVLVLLYFNWSNTRDARRHTQKIFQQQRLVREVPDAHRLSQAVHLLRPSVRLGFDYVIETDKDGKPPHIAEWNTGGSMPTEAEFDEALKRVTAIDSRGYAAMRRLEYPSVEEQLDAAFKARRGDTSEQEELDNRIEQIKNKYPKSDDEL
jgi:hypothetical protein